MQVAKNAKLVLLASSLSQNGNRLKAANKVNYVTKSAPVVCFVKLEQEVFEVRNSNLHNWMRYLARPPPRAEIGEGGAEIVMATIFNFICFLQQFQGPPFPTRVSTHPPS